MDNEHTRQVNQLADDIAAAISPCCICGKPITSSQLVQPYEDWYRHASCDPAKGNLAERN
jgi:hypothetical protein